MGLLAYIHCPFKLFFMSIYLAAPGLSCSMWDLAPWPGIKPGPPALGAQGPSHWTIKEAPYPLPWLRNSIMLWGYYYLSLGVPGGTSGKERPWQFRIHKRCRCDPWVRKIPWRGKWQPNPVFLPRESHGQRSLVGYSAWGRKVSDTTEVTCTHTLFISIWWRCQIRTQHSRSMRTDFTESISCVSSCPANEPPLWTTLFIQIIIKALTMIL